MSKVAQLGCIVCKQMGYPDTPCELHHIKDRRGMSKKSSDYEVIGLCYLHHRGDQGYHHSPKTFTARFGTQKELLQKVLSYVNCCGGCEQVYLSMVILAQSIIHLCGHYLYLVRDKTCIAERIFTFKRSSRCRDLFVD